LLLHYHLKYHIFARRVLYPIKPWLDAKTGNLRFKDDCFSKKVTRLMEDCFAEYAPKKLGSQFPPE
jgi:hypothetical protein